MAFYMAFAASAVHAQTTIVQDPTAPNAPANPAAMPEVPLPTPVVEPNNPLPSATQAIPTAPATPAEPIGPAEPAITVEPVRGGETATNFLRWRLSFGAVLDAHYDDNIFIRPKNKVDDFVFQLSPSVGIVWGDFRDKENNYGKLNYTADFRHYVENSNLDKIDQDVDLAFQLRFSKTLLKFDFDYRTLSTIDIDLGTLRRRTLYNGGISAEYNLTGKTSIEADLLGAATTYGTHQDGALDSDTLYGHLWLNAMLAPKFRFSIGALGGFLEQQDQSAQDFAQLVLRGRYVASEKLTLKGEVGFEYRTFESKEKLNVLGKIGAIYQPKDGTTLKLNLERSIIASASEVGRNYLATTVSLSFQQRLFQHFLFELTAGFTNANYQIASFRSVGQNREDNIYFVTPQISLLVRDWGEISLYYTFQKDDSDRSDLSFDDNIIGVQVTAKF